MKDFYVYILKCADGSFYTGQTDDLEKRIAEHQEGKIQCFTMAKLPVLLVYQANFVTKEEAISAERQIKGWRRAKKQALINKNWDLLRILAKTSQSDK